MLPRQCAEQFPHRVNEVFAQCGVGGGKIPRGIRLEDVPVLRLGHLEAMQCQDVEAQVRLHSMPERLDSPNKVLAPAWSVQGHVEPVVKTQPLIEIMTGAVHSIDELFRRVEDCCRGGRDRNPKGQGFQFHTNLEDILDVLRVEPRDSCAVVVVEDDLPFHLEPSEGLTDGNAGDAELGGQLGLVEPLSRAVATVDNRVSERARHVLDERTVMFGGG